jgi:hypothetical protein
VNASLASPLIAYWTSTPVPTTTSSRPADEQTTRTLRKSRCRARSAVLGGGRSVATELWPAGIRPGQSGRVTHPRSDAVNERDRNVIERCLQAAVEGPFFPDWEFHALFGLDREQIRGVLRA